MTPSKDAPTRERTTHMPVTAWHGDACHRCLDEPDPAWHVQRATHLGMCARHWAGATEAQRDDARWEDAMTAPADTAPRLTTVSIALDLLWKLPAAEPRREAA